MTNSRDARTRPQGRRTRVRRGGTRQGRRRRRVPAASDRVVPRGKARIGPTRLKSAPIRRKSAPSRPKSGRLGPYRPYRPKRPSQAEIKVIKKKKKTVQTHRFTNLKCPDPSFLHPASQSAPHLSVSLCSYFFLKNKLIPAVLLPFLEEIAPSVPSVPSLIFIYPLFVQPSGVLSLLFS